MSALVRKEIRLVMPAWVVAMLLATVPVWVVWPGSHGYFLQSPGDLVYAPFVIGVLLLGLSSFGQELNHRTFSMLLAQPVSRNRLWRVKTLVLAVALALVFLALFLSVHTRVDLVIATLKATNWRHVLNQPKAVSQFLGMIAETQRQALHNSLLLGGLCALTAYASGLWTNLLFRNTSVAFWSALLIPLGLGLLTAQLFGGAGQAVADVGLITVLGGYSVAGFLWAKKFFLRVQDVQWTGGILALPTLLKARSGTQAHGRKPIRALLRKELQLHQVNLLIAGLILLSHLADVAIRRLAIHYFAQHPMAAMIWGSWPLLWLAIPLLVGGVAIAEERKLGTLAGYLCLPTRRRWEFIVKFAVALILGVGLGGLVPVLIERLGVFIGLPSKGATVMFGNGPIFSEVFFFMVGSAGLVMLAFYASTLTRNLLQALGLAVALSVVTGGLSTLALHIGGSEMDKVALVPGYVPLWGNRLLAWIAWPVMILTALLLAYRNFGRLQIGWAVWRRNVVALVTSLVCAVGVTTVVYHRVWELWMPVEPPQALLTLRAFKAATGIKPEVDASTSANAVLLADGRLWLRQRSMRAIEVPCVHCAGGKMKTWQPSGPWHTGFVTGSQWRDVAVSMQSCLAIQTNGTLWKIQWNENHDGFALTRIGERHNWSRLSGSWNHFLALKSNGTLWAWNEGSTSTQRDGSTEKTEMPAQVGDDQDWVAIGSEPGTSVAVKADGSFWQWGQYYRFDTNGYWHVEKAEHPRKWLVGPRKELASLSLNGPALAAVYADGTLWVGGEIPSDLVAGKQRHPGFEGQLWRVGSGTNWRQAQYIASSTLVAIKRDGSLWGWSQYTLLGPYWYAMSQRILSGYSDWIALGAWRDKFLALTREGNLCLWNNPSPRSPYVPYSNSLLAPTRIKARQIALLR